MAWLRQCCAVEAKVSLRKQVTGSKVKPQAWIAGSESLRRRVALCARPTAQRRHFLQCGFMIRPE